MMKWSPDVGHISSLSALRRRIQMISPKTVAPKLIEKSIAVALSADYPTVTFHVRVSGQLGLQVIAIHYTDGPSIAAAFATARPAGFVAAFRFVRTTADVVISTTYSDMVVGWR
jgi:hypothetical protein